MLISRQKQRKGNPKTIYKTRPKYYKTQLYTIKSPKNIDIILAFLKADVLRDLKVSEILFQ